MARLVLELPEADSPAPFLARQAQKLAAELCVLIPGAEVSPTRTNFVYLRTGDAKKLTEGLVRRGIAVRFFAPDRLRITASTDEELKRLYTAIKEVLS